MRLFIAINFNDEIREKLLILQNELRSQSTKGNFSAVENMHLTLAFLDECDQKQTAAAKAAMNAVSFVPFDISIDNVGRFKRNGGDIWWAGMKVSKILTELHNSLNDKLIEAGFDIDRRSFSPHITIGREVITNASPWQAKPFGQTVSSIELMKSERINGRLTYTAIYKKT